MAVYRITLQIFNPKFSVEELKIPHEEKFHIKYDSSYSSSIFILPANKHVTTNDLYKYGTSLIKFLEINREILVDPGADDIHLDWTVYTLENRQCNFSIFDEEQLKVISSLNISMPISVYGMTQKEMLELLEESNYDRKTRLKISKGLI